MAYAWNTVLVALSSLLLLAVALFGLGMCRVAARATDPDVRDVEEWLAEAAAAEEETAQADPLDDLGWLDAEPQIHRAGGRS